MFSTPTSTWPRQFKTHGSSSLGEPICAYRLRFPWSLPRTLVDYVIALLVLLTHLAWTTPREVEPHVARALPWILTAVAIQLLSAGGGFPHFARFAVPFGIAGFLRGIVGLPLSVALLSFLFDSLREFPIKCWRRWPWLSQ